MITKVLFGINSYQEVKMAAAEDPQYTIDWGLDAREEKSLGTNIN